MNSFDSLHPAIQHHIVNSLGWAGLRPLQNAAIDPVLNGEHAIMLAPTAGGKTEAACFPILSRMLTENWSGLSVLYICPIKALLNNLEERLEYYGSLIGRRVGLWHGDVGASRKAKLLAEPPDILLTTPESLEAILVSSRIDHRRFLGDVRSVVIDEIHAFAGDDRGWHLLSILERVSVIAQREIQRLGLSATVGNTEELCDWLAGSCSAKRQVINPPAESARSADVQVDWVGSLQNAALVISRLHRGEKRLVFVDSRSRVELLAMELRGMGVSTFVSHSSLSLEERKSAEQAFSIGNDCVIVSTSTLELGIDVGDLDRVIQIDAPFSVSSFLQRIGRTGRRSDTARNCLFLATTEDAFLRAVALLELWRSGYVEPVVPPASPLHIYAQQVMALVLQERGMVQSDFDQWLSRMPGFSSMEPAQRQQLVTHMINTEVLHSDGGVIGIGSRGEKAFGYRYFMELVSVFTTPPMVKVLHGRQELGEVHELTFAVGDEGPALLTLGGRNWVTTYIDWPRRKAYVEPTDMKGRSQWLSSGQPLSFEVCQAIAGILSSVAPLEGLSKRAVELIDLIRNDFDWVENQKTTIVIDEDQNITWWTFSGSMFNAAIANCFQGEADKISFDNLSVTFAKPFTADELIRKIRSLLEQPPSDLLVPLDANFIQELKFSECLSQTMIDDEIAARYQVVHQFSFVKGQELVVVRMHE